MTMTTITDPSSGTRASSSTELSLQVVAAELIADGVRRLILSDPGGRRLPDWAPGAHIDVFLPGGYVRQYSLCGDRWDPYTYQIAVLREPNSRGGSAHIHDALTIGDRVGIGGPRNNFAMAPAPHYLFIAGGIGITPLLPMIHQAQMLEVDWRLLYGGRTAGSMAFVKDLSRYGDRVQLWPQDSRGLLPVTSAIEALAADAKIYCCGPAPLLAAVEALGAELPPGALRVERFVAEPLPAPVRSEAFQVCLERSGLTVTVLPGESILDAVAAAGVSVLSSCGRGLCGTCEATVLDGIPDHRDSVLTDHERASGASMLPCVSRACSDRLILDL